MLYIFQTLEQEVLEILEYSIGAQEVLLGCNCISCWESARVARRRGGRQKFLTDLQDPLLLPKFFYSPVSCPHALVAGGFAR
jgi:hypothetical protein